jgi:uncharacterized membrane protein YeiB
MPTQRAAGRLVGVDAARGTALLGMMAVHVFPAVDAAGETHVAYVVAAGRAAALFAFLAGVGIALSTGGPRPPQGRALAAACAGLAGRAGFLLVLGLLLGAVRAPPLVILAYYGVLFLLALPFVALRPPTLLLAALLCAVAMPLLSHLLRGGLPPAPPVDVTWGIPLPEAVRRLALTGSYPALPWLTYVLAGLAVGRLRLGSARVAGRLVLLGGAVAVGAKLASAWLLDRAGGVAALADGGSFSVERAQRALDAGLLGTTPADDPTWLLVAAPHSGTTLDLAHTTGTAALVLGLSLLAARGVRRALLPLACAGSMTLTLYCLHVLALREDGPLLLRDAAVLWWLHAAVALVLATAWRSLVGRGPVEALAAGLSGALRRAVASRSGDRPADSLRAC